MSVEERRERRREKRRKKQTERDYALARAHAQKG
jgi:hypothetical protein